MPYQTIIPGLTMALLTVCILVMLVTLNLQFSLMLATKNLIMSVTSTGQLQKTVKTSFYSAIRKSLVKKLTGFPHGQARVNALWPMQLHFLNLMKVKAPHYSRFHLVNGSVQRLWVAVCLGIFSDLLPGGKEFHPLIWKEFARMSMASDPYGCKHWLMNEINEVKTEYATCPVFRSQVDAMVAKMLTGKDLGLWSL